MCSGPWQGRLPARQANERSTDELDCREGWGLRPPGEDVSQEQGWLLVLGLTSLSVGVWAVQLSFHVTGEVAGKIQIVMCLPL